jgi:hypothetical protein
MGKPKLIRSRSPFIMLANMMQKLINYRGPTQAYQKEGTHSQHWPMQGLAYKYLYVTVGQLRLLGSREPIHNIGQCKGLHGNIYE